VSTTSSDYGILQRFAPQSANVWWAIVESNLTPRTFVVRTTDSGRRWRDVTPPVKLVSSSYFLGRNAGWVEADALHAPRSEPLYRTLDGGRSWQRLARVPTGCQLDFVDERHGWCAAIGSALGSASVALYRSADGGSSWTLVSRTAVPPAPSTPGSLPFGCDKVITFTSPTVGWASSFCNGGSPYLYTSRDGGSHWHALPQVPLPAGAPTRAGEGIGVPDVDGARVTLAVEIAGSPGATAIATSSDGGKSWRTNLVPGRLRQWGVDLIDSHHWRLTDGSVLMVTNDGGRHWRTSRPSRRMTDSVGIPLTLRFLSPLVGFAVPDGNNGPLWWTSDGGKAWKPVTVAAGPFTLPR
jgi:photosystem II stability/assembly factor-like uncharacterized protein